MAKKQLKKTKSAQTRIKRTKIKSSKPSAPSAPVEVLLKDVRKRSFNNLYVWLSEVPMDEAPETFLDYVERARRNYGRNLGVECRELEALLYDVARSFERRKNADLKLARAIKRMLANNPDRLMYGREILGNATPPVDGMIGGVTEAVGLTLQAGLAALGIKATKKTKLMLENYRIVLVSDYSRSFLLEAHKERLDIIEAGVVRLHHGVEDDAAVATGLATASEIERFSTTQLSFWWD